MRLGKLVQIHRTLDRSKIPSRFNRG